MRIVKGELISIEASDIKNGVLNLGRRVKTIGDNFDIQNFEIIKIIAPCLSSVGDYSFSFNKSFTGGEFPMLASVGNYSFRSNESFIGGEFPMLASVGNYSFISNKSFIGGEFPMLASVGNDSFSINESFIGDEFPMLASVGNYSFSSNKSFIGGEFPILASVGNDSFRSNESFTRGEFPMLASVGNDSFRSNKSFVSLKTKEHDLNTKNVDGYCFVIENEKILKGIKIYSGYNFISMNENVINKQVSFVAEKNGLTAHGDSVKKAISDLEFKIISEKLRNEPINEDTVIDINYYRLITGACEFGVRNWMQENKMNEESYKAKDLFPILKKTNAYGFEKFKKLVTF